MTMKRYSQFILFRTYSSINYISIWVVIMYTWSVQASNSMLCQWKAAREIDLSFFQFERKSYESSTLRITLMHAVSVKLPKIVASVLEIALIKNE